MSKAKPSNDSQLSLPVSTDRDHVLGPASAPITLVEYGDYECPYCRAAHFTLRELIVKLGDNLRFVFRNFPLTEMHPHAQPAAEAAEAAGAQGAFWEMHDTLYENQDALDDDDLLAYARKLGLKLTQFQAELTSFAHADRIRQDFISGVRSGVNGTPTLFINEVRYDGPVELPSLLILAEGQLGRPPKRRASARTR